MYTVMTNGGTTYPIKFNSDGDALEYMQKHWREFIDSVLSSDAISVYTPDGYLLAYISTVTGEQTVKHWNG